ncbi:MAG: branched-chain amino acid transport [Frankiales bacterium]|nr:branched-chain amino acid transport [Frankiales bacterium]
MTNWVAVLAASAVAYALKLVGYFVPARWLEHPSAGRVSLLLPAALLGALVAVQTFGNGHSLSFDARIVGLLVATVALWRRAPFLVVVVLAAAATAATRAAGIG